MAGWSSGMKAWSEKQKDNEKNVQRCEWSLTAMEQK